VNIGAGAEITIADLATLIASLCGYHGMLKFDASRPDGQPRRSLDVSRADQAFDFRATTSLRDGLRRTIDWYEQELAQPAQLESSTTP
jgi:GDP-L-fucose synthase